MTYRRNPKFPDTQGPTERDVQILRLDVPVADRSGRAHAVDLVLSVDPVTRLIVDGRILTHGQTAHLRTTGTGSVGPPESGVRP